MNEVEKAAAEAHLARAMGRSTEPTGPLTPSAPVIPSAAGGLPVWERVSAEEAPAGSDEPGRINLQRVSMWRLAVEGGWLYQERMTFSSVRYDRERKPVKVLSYGRGKPLFVPSTAPRAFHLENGVLVPVPNGVGNGG